MGRGPARWVRQRSQADALIDPGRRRGVECRRVGSRGVNRAVGWLAPVVLAGGFSLLAAPSSAHAAAGVRNCLVIYTDTGRADFDHDRRNLERLGNRLGLRWVWIGDPALMGQAISSLRRYGCNRINVMISAHGAPKDFFCPFGRNEGTLFAGAASCRPRR